MWAQERNGKVRYFERYKQDGKNKTVSVTYDKDTAHNRKEAQAVLADRIRREQDLANKGDTLKDVITAYNEYQTKHMRPSTYIRNARTLKLCLEHLDGEMPINDITAGYIKENLPDDNPSTYNQRIMRLKAMFRWAYENDKIDSIDFLRKIKPMNTDYKKKLQEKYLEKDELKKVLKELKIEKWRLVTEFLALTGLRINEFIALELSDIDLKKRTIQINKTYMPSVSKVSQFTKTDSSTREIYIQDELLPVIKRIMKIRRKGATTFVPGTKQKYMQYDSYRQYLGDASEKAIGRRITPHALRHTMTSQFAGAGIPLDVISRRLGHADSRITKQVYFHVTQDLKKNDSKAIRGVKIM